MQTSWDSISIKSNIKIPEILIFAIHDVAILKFFISLVTIGFLRNLRKHFHIAVLFKNIVLQICVHYLQSNIKINEIGILA